MFSFGCTQHAQLAGLVYGNPMARKSRKRRFAWADRAAAHTYFGARFRKWDPRALEAFCDGALRSARADEQCEALRHETTSGGGGGGGGGGAAAAAAAGGGGGGGRAREGPRRDEGGGGDRGGSGPVALKCDRLDEVPRHDACVNPHLARTISCASPVSFRAFPWVSSAPKPYGCADRE